MAQLSRNKQHFIAMTVIYNELVDFIYGDTPNLRDARDLINEMCECDYDQIPEYIFNVVSYSMNNYGAIVEAFKPFLKNWNWERLPLLTQSILIMSYAHMKIEEIDKKVVINIAVELAKKYEEEKQKKFINAILDEVL